MATRKTTKSTRSRPTFADWKARCNAHAAKVLPGLGDLFASDDPYDLTEVAKDAFAAKQAPAAFVEEQFAEDISRNEYDDELAEQASQEEGDETSIMPDDAEHADANGGCIHGLPEQVVLGKMDWTEPDPVQAEGRVRRGGKAPHRRWMCLSCGEISDEKDEHCASCGSDMLAEATGPGTAG